MQLQALLSSAASATLNDPEEALANVKLIVQLSETVAECDGVMNEILSVTDQITQINKLIELHWASALAIALRKVSFWNGLPLPLPRD